MRLDRLVGSKRHVVDFVRRAFVALLCAGVAGGVGTAGAATADSTAAADGGKTAPAGTAAATAATATAAGDPIRAAVADPSRTAEDRARDERDHAVDVLTFFGFEPGMIVADIFAAGGYYSELIGRVVGPTGKVYLYNNAGFAKFAEKPLAARVASGRLQNVSVIQKEVGQIGIPAGSVDVVLMSMSYHDLYFKDEGWSVDPAALFTEVHAMLKPGGELAIIDHAAKPGTGSSAAQELHRIDEAFARKDIESRGFKYVGSLDVLHNSTDDHTKVVFDPSVRGHTDRFIDKFVRE
jgi:predicted methyltransferase